MTIENQLLRTTEGLQYLAVIDDNEEDVDQFESRAFTISRKKSRGSNARRRSSVRRKLSISSAHNLENVAISNDYSSGVPKRTIDDFETLKILGIGSFGRVYLVRDNLTGGLFAKKTIKKAKISVDKKLYKSHKNERDILSSVSHQNIVKLFYAFHDNDDINFILEYIPGGELFYHLCSKKYFNEKDSVFYIAEISLALHHLHQQGVIYRDLKPENVMLNASGHVVLTDFGLSSMDETSKSVLGTPEFAAPEVLSGDEYSYQADWWSLGIVLYDLLVGEPPFMGPSTVEILHQIKTRVPRLPGFITSHGKFMLKNLLHRVPEKRMDVDQIWEEFKAHPFFRSIDWEQLQTSTPPIIPSINKLEDADNFDQKYIKKILAAEKKQQAKKSESSSIQDSAADEDVLVFKGFSFIASEEVLEEHFN